MKDLRNVGGAPALVCDLRPRHGVGPGAEAPIRRVGAERLFEICEGGGLSDSPAVTRLSRRGPCRSATRSGGWLA